MEHFIFPKVNFEYSKETNIKTLTEESERVITEIYSSIDSIKNLHYSKKQISLRKLSPKRFTFSPKKSTKFQKSITRNFDPYLIEDSIRADSIKKITLTQNPKQNSDTIFNFFDTELPVIKHKSPEIGNMSPKETLNYIYRNFNGISNEYNKISNNIEKSIDRFKNKLFLIHNKEKIKQNKILGDVKPTKCSTDPKPKIIKELNKKEVLKEYNLINKIKDDYAEYVWKRYEPPIVNNTIKKIKFQNNHKQIINLLDSMRIKKKYK